MIVAIRKSFVKDSLKLNPGIKKELSTIIQMLESVDSLSSITNCKKLKGHRNAFRIRLRNYHIGLFYTNNYIELVRILDRKEVYRYFP